jgi:acetate kinase
MPVTSVLVVNAGSSSLKLRVLGPDDAVLATADVEPDDSSALGRFLAEVPEVDAVGHRVVHGGPRHTSPVLLDDEVVADLRALVPLAPLHQPAALAGIEAVARALPDVPAVACFDTAFHSTLPPEAFTYPLPREWRDRFGLRRFGFHGLSHAYASRRAAELAAPHPARRVVTCHLGAGSSLAAVVDGRCVDTTMGFTPNEGIPMATRSGSVDPGLLTWLLDQGITAGELDDGLQHGSGLTGLVGTGDMRAVTERADAGDPDASLAVDVWLHRLCAAIAAMAASAGGLDVLVFTGGIGEHSPSLRAAATARLGWLGVTIDDRAERDRDGADADVSPSDTPVRTVVVRAREDIEIARGVRSVVAER